MPEKSNEPTDNPSSAEFRKHLKDAKRVWGVKDKNKQKRKEKMETLANDKSEVIIREKYVTNPDKMLQLREVEVSNEESDMDGVILSAGDLENIVIPLMAAVETFPIFQKNGENGIIYNYRRDDNETLSIEVESSIEGGFISVNQRIFDVDREDTTFYEFIADPVVMMQVALKLLYHVN